MTEAPRAYPGSSGLAWHRAMPSGCVWAKPFVMIVNTARWTYAVRATCEQLTMGAIVNAMSGLQPAAPHPRGARNTRYAQRNMGVNRIDAAGHRTRDGAGVQTAIDTAALQYVAHTGITIRLGVASATRCVASRSGPLRALI